MVSGLNRRLTGARTCRWKWLVELAQRVTTLVWVLQAGLLQDGVEVDRTQPRTRLGRYPHEGHLSPQKYRDIVARRKCVQLPDSDTR